MVKMEPEQLLAKHADNYHRWVGTDWAFIELCGPAHGNDWSATAEARVKKFADYGHSLGYLVSFYFINGFSDEQNQGWTADSISARAKRRQSGGTPRFTPTPTSSPPISTRMSPGHLE
jgi:hypothetical protein